jgi:hypothetical protein
MEFLTNPQNHQNLTYLIEYDPFAPAAYLVISGKTRSLLTPASRLVNTNYQSVIEKVIQNLEV